jgi:hypothetical protein
MEQLKINKHVLSAGEKKNVLLSIACGCLNTVHNAIPGPPHKKQKRVLRTLATEIMAYVGPRIPRVESRNSQVFHETITAGAKVMDQILDENGTAGLHIMLNLAGFCIDQLPVSKSNIAKYNSLFDMCDGAHRHQDKKSGEDIFKRIEAEVTLLVTQRGGAIF